MGYPDEIEQRIKHGDAMSYPNQDVPRSVYQNEVMRTCPNFSKDTIETKLSLAGLGLSGEAGEVTDLIKKYLHHGKPLDREKLIKEMADVRWYLEYLAATLEIDMEEVEAIGMVKTRARFPNGFSFEAANAKADEKK